MAKGALAQGWLLRERRPGDRRVLYLSTLAVLCAIAATVLLANGQRNLHLLLGAPPLAGAVPVNPQIIPAIAVMAEKPAELRMLPARSFSSEDIDAYSTFVRLSSLPAQALCRFLAEAGLRNEGWRVSEIDPQSHECPAQLRLFSGEPGGGFDTAFADVKGDAGGRILRLRLKVTARDAVNRAILDGKIAAILDFVVTQSGWSDFSELGKRVLATGDFTVESHGLRVSRQQERLSPNSYNLVLSPVFETQGARNAYAYFLSTRGMLPGASGNLSNPAQIHHALRHDLAPDGIAALDVSLSTRFFPPRR